LTSIKDIQALTSFGLQVRLLLKLYIIWPVDSEENHENGCHWRSLWLKCTNFDLGSAPDPAGELRALPRPQAGFKGPYF